MRLFVGLPVPVELATQLAGLARRVSVPEPRWTPPEKMHVTLVFLGEVGEEQAEAVRRAVETMPVESMELAVTELGGFLHTGVLYAKVPATPVLLRQQAETVSRMKACGCEMEEQPYRPHITLARSPVRFHFPGCKLVQPLRFVADTVHLYRSMATAEETHYEVLCSAQAPRIE